MPQSLLVFILVFILLPVLQAQNCTENDYKASYTECTSSNTRDLVYYRKADSNCTGGVPATAPVSFFFIFKFEYNSYSMTTSRFMIYLVVLRAIQAHTFHWDKYNVQHVQQVPLALVEGTG
jgi:hypothetical protein